MDLFYIEGRTELESSSGFRPEETRFGAPMDGKDRGKRDFGFNQPPANARPQRDQRQRGDTVILDDRAAEKLTVLLSSAINRNDKPKVIMIKGSRALHLERVVSDLLNGMED